MAAQRSRARRRRRRRSPATAGRDPGAGRSRSDPPAPSARGDGAAAGASAAARSTRWRCGWRGSTIQRPPGSSVETWSTTAAPSVEPTSTAAATVRRRVDHEQVAGVEHRSAGRRTGVDRLGARRATPAGARRRGQRPGPRAARGPRGRRRGGTPSGSGAGSRLGGSGAGRPGVEHGRAVARRSPATSSAR